jgi:hypothetical protein
MANIQIPNLPAVVSLAGEELFEGVQSGTSVKISLSQIIAATRAGLPTTLPIPVSLGGTGAVTLTGYVKGSGTSPLTASATIPSSDITGLGTMSVQNANAVAITGGTAALTGASSVTVSSASPALTVTQTGAGNAILVEDSTSPDSTPFVVNSLGRVGIGTATPTSPLSIAGATAKMDLLGTVSASIAISADSIVSVDLKKAGDNDIGSRINFNKSRGTTAAPTPVISGDGIGHINYLVYQGLTQVRVSSIDSYVDTFTADNDFSTIITFSTRPNGVESPVVERLRIGPAGQFGIGGANYGTSGQTIVSAGSAAAPAWGALGTAGGGTGVTSYTIGDILFASAPNVLSALADVATGNALISGGVGVAPSYGKIGLTTHVSGILPVANGGTGVTTAPAEAARILGFTTTVTTGIATILTNTSSQYQLFTGTLSHSIQLPVTSTISTGWTFHIVNNSSSTLNILASNSATITTIIPNVTVMVTCISTGVTDPTAWEFGFTDFGSITGTGANVLADGATMTNGVFNGTVGATTPATGIFTTVSDAAGNVRDIVNNAKVAAYILAATDNGEMINITTGGVTVNSGIFSAGNNVTIYNNSAASQTVTQGAGVTLRLAGSATTGNRTLAQRGICTIVCVASNEFVVSGAGVT